MKQIEDSTMRTTIPVVHARVSRAVTIASLTVILSAPALVFAGWPACERNRVNNLVYHCTNPGQQCGANKECVDVTGGGIVAWSDCKCRATGAAVTVMAGGSWTVLALGPILPDAPTPFVLQSGIDDVLEVFTSADTSADGAILESQLLTSRTAMSGSLTLMFLAGPPDAMPVFITELSWAVDPFEIIGQSTGDNTITLAPGGESVVGLYNQITGEIRFDTGVPCTIVNDRFPGGRAMFLHPALGFVSGSEYALMPSWTLTLDECFDRESFDGYENGAQLHSLGGWKGWDGDEAFAAQVSQDTARTGSQSVRVELEDDIVHEICTTGDGAYSLTAWQYIPSDFSAPGMGPNQGSWFVLLNAYQDEGPYDWAMQMQFNPNTGLIKIHDGNGSNSAPVPFATDRWVKIQVIIDLEDDWTRIYYDDDLVTEYSWTGGIIGDGVGDVDIAAVDLFANGSSAVYYDDMQFERIDDAPPPCPADLVNSDTFQPPPDGHVDGADLGFLLTEWGEHPRSLADIVSSDTFQPPPDGVVDGADLAVVLAEWGVCD